MSVIIDLYPCGSCDVVYDQDKYFEGCPLCALKRKVEALEAKVEEALVGVEQCRRSRKIE
jgi:hypothetical protein